MAQIPNGGTRVCTSHSSQDGLRSAGVPLLTAWTGEDVSRRSSLHKLDDLHTCCDTLGCIFRAVQNKRWISSSPCSQHLPPWWRHEAPWPPRNPLPPCCCGNVWWWWCVCHPELPAAEIQRLPIPIFPIWSSPNLLQRRAERTFRIIGGFTGPRTDSLTW